MRSSFRAFSGEARIERVMLFLVCSSIIRGPLLVGGGAGDGGPRKLARQPSLRACPWFERVRPLSRRVSPATNNVVGAPGGAERWPTLPAAARVHLRERVAATEHRF